MHQLRFRQPPERSNGLQGNTIRFKKLVELGNETLMFQAITLDHGYGFGFA